MNKLLNLKIIGIAKTLSRKMTLLEIVELLEKSKVNPKGNVTNTSKKDLILNSLRSAKEPIIKKFFASINKLPASRQDRYINLHPTFKKTKVERFINTTDYEEAVRVAFVRINNRVKKITSLSGDGASLMRTVFSRNNPMLKVNSLKTLEEKNEQEGLMHIFEGSMLAFRNPQSHNDEKKMSYEESVPLIRLANYLMTILDKFEVVNKEVK